MNTSEKSGDLFNGGGFADSIAKGASIVGSNIANAANDAASDIGEFANDAAKVVVEGIPSALEAAGDEISKAKAARKASEPIFNSLDSLQPVVNVINDAAIALNDKSRTIKESAIPEVAAGALGAGVGGIGSFLALYGIGTVGLSAAGISSGLAGAGAIVGAGMAAGVFVLAAPVAIAAGTGVALASHLKNKQLTQEKERLYKVALAKHQAIIQALKDEADASSERLDYLNSLNILLEKAVKDLRSDLVAQGE